MALEGHYDDMAEFDAVIPRTGLAPVARMALGPAEYYAQFIVPCGLDYSTALVAAAAMYRMHGNSYPAVAAGQSFVSPAQVAIAYMRRCGAVVSR